MELILNTEQKLIISQKMLQSVEILQMNSFELFEHIKELANENPLIEIEDNDFEKIKEQLNFLSKQTNTYNYSSDHQEENDRWNLIADDENLFDDLIFQSYGLKLNSEEQKIAEYIIYSLDNHGYFLDEDINGKFNEKTFKNVLRKIQSLEPAGIAAKDLKESLLIQLIRLKVDDNTPYYIIINHLDTLSKNHLPIIAKKLSISIEEVKKAVELIKSLNPILTSEFGKGDIVEYIKPEVLVEKDKNTNFIVSMINDRVPRVFINNYYKNLLNSDSDEVKDFITKKFNQAKFLIKNIDDRKSTILRTSESIVKHQSKFFEDGKTLVPMTLEDIADKVDLHISTVSRALKDKYLQCSFGVFPFSHFFTNVISEENQNTPEYIKDLLVKLINDEDKKKPLSDQRLADLLLDCNLKISRRTVAKYRNQLEIPATSMRRKY